MGHQDRIGAVGLLVFFVVYGYLTQNITLLPSQLDAAFTAKTLPATLSILGIIGALWLLVFPGARRRGLFNALSWSKFLLCLGVMIFYALALRPAGFMLATTLLLVCLFTILGERRFRITASVAFLVTTLFWVLLTYGLGVFLNPWPAVGTLGF